MCGELDLPVPSGVKFNSTQTTLPSCHASEVVHIRKVPQYNGPYTTDGKTSRQPNTFGSGRHLHVKSGLIHTTLVSAFITLLPRSVRGAIIS